MHTELKEVRKQIGFQNSSLLVKLLRLNIKFRQSEITCFYRPQRSWGKVIFSQAFVILSTGGGGVVCGCRGACVVARGCMVARGGAWLPGGMCGCGGVHGCGGACVVVGGHAWDTMRYGQWAGSLHPTGMHSCLTSGDTSPFRGATETPVFGVQRTLMPRFFSHTQCFTDSLRCYPYPTSWLSRVRLYLHESESDIASIWIPRESNLMFTLSSDKDQRKIRFYHRFRAVWINLKYRPTRTFTPIKSTKFLLCLFQEKILVTLGKVPAIFFWYTIFSDKFWFQVNHSDKRK